MYTGSYVQEGKVGTEVYKTYEDLFTVKSLCVIKNIKYGVGIYILLKSSHSKLWLNKLINYVLTLQDNNIRMYATNLI